MIQGGGKVSFLDNRGSFLEIMSSSFDYYYLSFCCHCVASIANKFRSHGGQCALIFHVLLTKRSGDC